ncbi:ATP-binding protein [Streptomyces sp. AC602_WCS936]|uniref:ATP-binding protein n=1 Tax=Streptomyces sp. AC602_WCS936 TaxID=2823685 RepID=UPI0027E59E99|nr:ATP-binding protein [Streptomyces sp. AC602_WCS936]
MNDYFPSVLVGHRPADQYRMSFTAGAHSARHVRRIVRSYLREWDLAELTDAVELGVTELLANVVRHVPDRRCTLLLLRRADGGGVRVEVADGCPRPPVPAGEVREDAEDGRGLVLLGAVVDKWGVGPGPGEGKTVWFECGGQARDSCDGTTTP